MWKPSGHIRQKPRCLESGREKRSDYWRILTVKAHSHTHPHTVHKPWWCQQLSVKVVLPPVMTAAGISGRPSKSHVSGDWWEVCIQAQTVSRSLSFSLCSDSPAGKFSTSACEWLAYIKITAGKTAPEQRSGWLNVHVPPLQTEKTCCCKCLENSKWWFAVVMICSGYLTNNFLL